MSDDARPSCTAVILPPTRDELSSRSPACRSSSASRSARCAAASTRWSRWRPTTAARCARCSRADPRTAAIPVVGGALDATIATERVALIPSDCVDHRRRADARARTRDCNGTPIAFALAGDDRHRRSGRARIVGARDGSRAGATAPPSWRSPASSACRCADAPAPPRAERALLRHARRCHRRHRRADRPLRPRAVDAHQPPSRAHAAAPQSHHHHRHLIGLTGAWCLAQGTYGCRRARHAALLVRGDHRRLRRRGGAAQVPGDRASATSTTSPPTTSSTSRSSSASASACTAPIRAGRSCCSARSWSAASSPRPRRR